MFALVIMNFIGILTVLMIPILLAKNKRNEEDRKKKFAVGREAMREHMDIEYEREYEESRLEESEFPYTFIEPYTSRSSFDEKYDKAKLTEVIINKNYLNDWYLLEEGIKLNDSVFYKIFNYVGYDEVLSKDFSFNLFCHFDITRMYIPNSQGFYLNEKLGGFYDKDETYEEMFYKIDGYNSKYIAIFNPHEDKTIKIQKIALLRFCLFLREDEIINGEKNRIEELKGNIRDKALEESVIAKYDDFGILGSDVEQLKEILMEIRMGNREKIDKTVDKDEKESDNEESNSSVRRFGSQKKKFKN